MGEECSEPFRVSYGLRQGREKSVVNPSEYIIRSETRVYSGVIVCR